MPNDIKSIVFVLSHVILRLEMACKRAETGAEIGVQSLLGSPPCQNRGISNAQ